MSADKALLYVGRRVGSIFMPWGRSRGSASLLLARGGQIRVLHELPLQIGYN